MAVGAEGRLLAGRYRVLRRLGTGGMASVFLCEDERLGRQVAVKRLHAESPGDTARRFQREAKLGASLNHRNVVSIFDTVTDDDGVLIVMEYVDGTDLAKAIRSSGRIEPARAVDILRGVAAALDHAHAAGVVHRDVKPANILIGSDGDVKLADLGIATALESTRITMSGAVLGTVGYMAPEQIDGAEPGPAADVYSLATVAFEVLSGHKARVGKTPVEIARRVVSEPPPLLSDTWPEAPAEATHAIRRAMAKDPAARPESAGAFVDELARALGGKRREAGTVTEARESGTVTSAGTVTGEGREPGTVTSAGTVTRASRRRPGWLLPAAAVLAALLVAGAILLSSGDDGESSPEPSQSQDGSAGQEEQSGGSGSGEDEAEPEAEGGSGQAAPGSPEEAVQSFYTLAANDDFEGAWALAAESFREQLGGYDAFVAQQRSLESIEFTTLVASGDTVEIQTVARHSNRTDRCTGTLAVVQSGGGWQIARAETIDCRQG